MIHAIDKGKRRLREVISSNHQHRGRETKEEINRSRWSKNDSKGIKSYAGVVGEKQRKAYQTPKNYNPIVVHLDFTTKEEDI